MNAEPRKNVFVTQLHDREDEDADNVKAYAVVQESAGRLLETGINTLQKTLLLKKEVEVERVQGDLTRKREEFRQRMEQCAERQVSLQKNQQKMKDRVTKFEKFIAENEAKRRRAIQKYQQEIKLREQKTRDLEQMKIELEELKVRHKKLRKKIEIYHLYEKFLLQAIEKLPENYLEMSENQINSLMMRYDTLHATNQSLVSDLEGNATELERLKGEYETLKQEHDKIIVSMSSEVSIKQKKRDRLIDGSKQKEENFLVEKEMSREELAELGQILMAIGNIAMKCQRKSSTTGEKSITCMDLDERLQVIKEYVIDQKDIFNMAEELSKHSASKHSGSARRNAGRVRFE